MANQVKDGRKITIGPARLSFTHLFKPYAFDEKDSPKYRTHALWPKTDEKINAKIKSAIKLAVAEKWGNKVPKDLALPVRDGATQEYEEYADMNFISTKTSIDNKPGVVDQRMNKIVDPSEAYSGCWAHLSVFAYAYDHAGNKGVTLLLNNVMILDNAPAGYSDEALGGGGTSVESDFEGVEVVASSTDEDDGGWL